MPALALGGWANPHADPAAQVGHLLDEHANAEFYLTQIVSHHSRDEVERFLAEADARGPDAARACSACSTTGRRTRRRCAALSGFLPVPVEELTREFADGRHAGGDLRALDPRADGRRRPAFYISNLPLGRAAATLQRIMTRTRDGCSTRLKAEPQSASSPAPLN